MGTTAQKLQAILNSKAAIKSAIENKGVPVGSATLAEYASKIASIVGEDPDGMNGFLSVESKTIPTSASATTNITYNKNCGILDENYKKWDTLDWHQRWVDNGYSATGLSKPIGIWMKAFGLDLTYLWRLKDAAGYSDASGTITPTTTTFAFIPVSVPIINTATAADRTVWPANQSGNIAHGTAGKYKSATWRAVNNGDGLDMVCDNTLETFHIPSRNVGGANIFRKDNNEDYMESYYQRFEFFHALFAICSGISTTQSNGTKTNVDILNASGQQAAVNEDMYFWIGGTNTGLYAKYNLNCFPNPSANATSGQLTQAITDAIYAKQKENGINMNDTGVNSAAKPTLLSGMKGAEAIAVDGYWYIKTPYIGGASTSFENQRNVVDAPAVYLCRHLGVSVPSDRKLYPYYLNLPTHITSLVNLLRTTEGLSDDVPTVVSSGTICSSILNSSSLINALTLQNGSIMPSQQQYLRNTVIPCALSTQQYT